MMSALFSIHVIAHIPFSVFDFLPFFNLPIIHDNSEITRIIHANFRRPSSVLDSRFSIRQKRQAAMKMCNQRRNNACKVVYAINFFSFIIGYHKIDAWDDYRCWLCAQPLASDHNSPRKNTSRIQLSNFKRKATRQSLLHALFFHHFLSKFFKDFLLEFFEIYAPAERKINYHEGIFMVSVWCW